MLVLGYSSDEIYDENDNGNTQQEILYWNLKSWLFARDFKK